MNLASTSPPDPIPISPPHDKDFWITAARGKEKEAIDPSPSAAAEGSIIYHNSLSHFFPAPISLLVCNISPEAGQARGHFLSREVFAFSFFFSWGDSSPTFSKKKASSVTFLLRETHPRLRESFTSDYLTGVSGHLDTRQVV